MSEDRVLIHATCVAVGEHGILIIGPPGSGKSDLALRLIDGAGYGIGSEPLRGTLISDDQTLVSRRGDRLIGSPPETIAGKIEIRGLGIVVAPYLPDCALWLAVRLEPACRIERMPGERRFELIGAAIPEMSVDAAWASAPARVRAALRNLVAV